MEWSVAASLEPEVFLSPRHHGPCPQCVGGGGGEDFKAASSTSHLLCDCACWHTPSSSLVTVIGTQRQDHASCLLTWTPRVFHPGAPANSDPDPLPPPAPHLPAWTLPGAWLPGPSRPQDADAGRDASPLCHRLDVPCALSAPGVRDPTLLQAACSWLDFLDSFVAAAAGSFQPRHPKQPCCDIFSLTFPPFVQE